MSTSSDLIGLADGRELQIWRGGAEHGTPVFFLPGTPDSRLIAASGAGFAERRGVRLIAVNRPGYGRSTPAPFTHLSIADDVAAVADALAIDTFAVLGMSLGGPFALATAARYSDRVFSAAAIASPADVTQLDPPWHRDDLTAEQEAFFAQLRAMTADDAVETMRAEYETYVQRMHPADGDDAALAARVEAQLHPLDAASVAGEPLDLRAAGIREALATPEGYLRDAALTFRPWEFSVSAISCPVHLCYGALDPQVSPRCGDLLASHITHARLVRLPGTAHLGALLGNWDDILRALTD